MRPLKQYFLATFALSWTCFISAVALSGIAGSSTAAIAEQVLVFAGAVSPSLVALWISSRSGVPRQAKDLLNKIGRWQVGFKWYLFATGFMIATKLSAALIYKFITGAWPAFGHDPWYLMLISVFFSTWVQAGEEIGWRGFALPRMSARMGLPLAAVLLGIIWACWHLPFFFVKDADTYSQSFPLYLIQVTALSVVMGWLYWKTKGSLLLTMVLHAAINNTKDIVPSASTAVTGPFAFSHSLVAWLTAGLLWIFAAYCLVGMRHVKALERTVFEHRPID